MKVARETTIDRQSAQGLACRRGFVLLLSALAMVWFTLALSPASFLLGTVVENAGLPPEASNTPPASVGGLPQSISSSRSLALKDCGEHSRDQGVCFGSCLTTYCPPGVGALAAGTWQSLEQATLAAIFSTMRKMSCVRRLLKASSVRPTPLGYRQPLSGNRPRANRHIACRRDPSIITVRWALPPKFFATSIQRDRNNGNKIIRDRRAVRRT